MKKFMLFACLLAVLAGCGKKDEPTKNGVRDICGNIYPVVTIGGQTWMAENYRCSKYDTESEAYKEGRYTVPTSAIGLFTPYYIDATDKSKWSSTEYAGNLSDEQVAKLGYLYNWAAAVGVADGYQHSESFADNRQGICPNGWHIPTLIEYSTLHAYIEVIDGKGIGNAGKHLKTTSGWYDGGNGEDGYHFAALPAGYFGLNSVRYVGYNAVFWSATPRDNSDSYLRILQSDKDDYVCGYNIKICGNSVRCVKN